MTRRLLGLVAAVVLGWGCAAGTQPGTGGAGTVVAPEPAPPAAETPEAAAEAAEVPAALFAAVDARPADPVARRQLATALFAALRRHEAVEQFEKLVELSPTPRHLLDLALAYNAVSRVDDAEATYRRILALAPSDAVALHNLGNIALHRGEPDRAIELYRQAIAARADYLLAWFHLGDALTQAESFREAYRAFEQVLSLEPSTAEELEAFDDALYRLAALDLMMGATERAAGMLAELLKARPDHPRAHYAYGQALLRLGREDEARREFETHMRLLAAREPDGPMASRD